jgi:hypothetical protein
MSEYTKKQLESLTQDELIQIGLDEFNIDLDGSMSKTAMVAEIWDSIKSTKDAHKDANKDFAATQKKDKEVVKITVAKGAENEPDYVVPAINGRVWQIKRGEEVEVPRFVARHLQSLTNTVYKPVSDSAGKIIGKREEQVSRYNVQVAI